MRVITLDKQEFEDACIALAERMSGSEGIDALIGVRTGGAIVADIIYNNFKKQNRSVKYFEVESSRYGTSTKKTNSVRVVLKALPQAVLNVLRIIEHYMVAMKLRLTGNIERSIAFNIDLVNYLKKQNAGVVYIIDDAVDSGATAKQIIDKCESLNSSIDYKIAVLVVTQSNPLIMPDVCLYQNVLLRFPWSNDCK